MAKDVFFTMAVPPSSSLLEKMGEFLVQHAAKQADMEVRGTFRERMPGETGAPVRLSARAKEEAS